jgi:hypothetical protein
MYRWARRHDGYLPLSERFVPPRGFSRVPVARGSYADWLRHLPLLPKGSPVRSFRGREILSGSDRALAAVVDLDVGKRDRQQCADTLMRLRGEYLYSIGKPKRTRFRWAGGRTFGYADWSKGLRPVRHGRKWVFEPKAQPSAGYRSFRRYLGYMFSWTGTIHQVSESRVRDPQKLRAGDFFIQPGSPGHAVAVIDIARDAQGHTKALVGQGFMPAQDMHLLRAPDGTAWFDLSPPAALKTPIWTAPFRWTELRRFRY